MEIPVFEYMRWAKTHSGAHRYDLTLSAAPPLPLDPIPRPAEVRSYIRILGPPPIPNLHSLPEYLEMFLVGHSHTLACVQSYHIPPSLSITCSLSEVPG